MMRVCRRFGHRAKLHRTTGGAAFVTCWLCGRRLAFWPAATVRGMLPGELETHAERCRHAVGGVVDVDALRIGARR